jgi:hypothetical protein
MKDIAVTAALTAAASLGCVPFVMMFTDWQRVSAWEQVTNTVGVVAFLTAAGQMLVRGGLAAAVLLVLLTWLVHDTVRRHALSRRAFAACAWVSLAFLLSSVGFNRG